MLDTAKNKSILKENETMVKILCVCGIGLGTSMMAKMQVEKLCDEVGLKADVEPLDAGSLRGHKSDLVITTTSIAKTLGNMDTPVVVIENFANKAALREELIPILEGLK